MKKPMNSKDAPIKSHKLNIVADRHHQFGQYLVDKDGEVVDSFSSFTKPDSKSFRKTIEETLGN